MLGVTNNSLCILNTKWELPHYKGHPSSMEHTQTDWDTKLNPWHSCAYLWGVGRHWSSRREFEDEGGGYPLLTPYLVTLTWNKFIYFTNIWIKCCWLSLLLEMRMWRKGIFKWCWEYSVEVTGSQYEHFLKIEDQNCHTIQLFPLQVFLWRQQNQMTRGPCFIQVFHLKMPPSFYGDIVMAQCRDK